eukprot:6178291-Pleurochrysis_carterae.AAC.1
MNAFCEASFAKKGCLREHQKAKGRDDRNGHTSSEDTSVETEGRVEFNQIRVSTNEKHIRSQPALHSV